MEINVNKYIVYTLDGLIDPDPTFDNLSLDVDSGILTEQQAIDISAEIAEISHRQVTALGEKVKEKIKT